MARSIDWGLVGRWCKPDCLRRSSGGRASRPRVYPSVSHPRAPQSTSQVSRDPMKSSLEHPRGRVVRVPPALKSPYFGPPLTLSASQPILSMPLHQDW